MLGDVREDAATHVAAPDDTGDSHGDKGGGDAYKNHGAQVDAERTGDEDRTGRRRHEGITGCQSREQGNAIVEGRLLGLRCHAKRERDQNDHAGLEEHRGANDQAGDAQRPAGVTLAKGVNEGLGDLLGAAALLQDLAEHRAQANEQCDVLQRGAHALGDGIGHQVERHAGTDADRERRNHHRQHRVQLELDDERKQQRDTHDGGDDEPGGVCHKRWV